MQNRIEIQIQYNNRTFSNKANKGSSYPRPQGKWYDVRWMHSDVKHKAKMEPDVTDVLLGRMDREVVGYCIGEHCYNRFSINKTISGMGTLKDIIQSWAKYYLLKAKIRKIRQP